MPPRPLGPPPSRAVLAALLLLSPSALAAQVVRGTVTDAADRPLGGAVVAVLDSTHAVLARTLTEADGRYQLSARAGTVRLRAQRIGFQPLTTAPLTLRAGDAVAQPLVLSGARTVLATVKVGGRNSCGRALEGDAAAFDVWQQALASLDASAVTSATRGLTTSLMEVTRVLDPRGRILDQGLLMRTESVVQPWRSLPADTLRKYGYTTLGRDDALTYNAPGIDVLTGPAFQRDHCFRLAASRDTTEIGLAFEPAPERFRVAELSGVIWLTRATAELRRADFTFGRVPGMPEVPYAAGGSMRFARLPSGGVVIEQWELRMPVLTRDNGMGRSVIRLDQVRSTGGLLVSVRRGRDTLYTRPRVTLAGVVRDSISGTPLVGATVQLTGTEQRTATGAGGRFTLTDVLPGQYALAVSTPALDSLRAASAHTVLVRDSMPPADVRVPPAQLVAQQLCGAGFAARTGAGVTTGAIMGAVTDKQTGSGMANVPVAADWVERGTGSLEAIREGQGRRLQTRTDANGTYRLCGVPTYAVLTVRALPAAGRAAPQAVQVRAEARVAALSLVIDANLPPVATFRGVVVADSTGTPIADAEVSVAGVFTTTRSDDRGGFRLDDIPAGAREIAVKRVGFAPVTAALTFAPNDEEERRVVMQPLRVLDSVVVLADRPTLRLREFEEHRKVGLGWFLGRDELERRDGQMVRQVLLDAKDLHMVGGQYPVSARYKVPIRAINNATEPCPPPLSYSPPLVEKGGGTVCACYAVVVLDGVVLNRGTPAQAFDLRSITVSQLEAVEWYATPAQLPAQFNVWDAPCGVLVFHTRRPGSSGPAKR